jgi:hypothetical protein
MPEHYGHSDQRGKKSAQYHAKNALVPVVRYHNVAISSVVFYSLSGRGSKARWKRWGVM